MIRGLKMLENQEKLLSRLASGLCVAGLSFRVSDSRMDSWVFFHVDRMLELFCHGSL